jgi:protocatechuate 4,5-dioxygenase beta chain
MATIVGGFICPHAPHIFSHRGAGNPAQEQKVYDAFTHISDRIAVLEADTVIMIGSDHYILFGTTCLPQMLICTGEASGPIERFEACPPYELNLDTALAKHLYSYGQDNGVDWAVSKSLVVDHAIAVPHTLAVRPNPNVKVVPVYINSGVAPGISKARAFRLGRQIREAVEAYPTDERVVVIGTGGISHWVGSAQMGRINPDFDQLVVDAEISGDAQKLIDLTDAYIIENGGEGAMEIRNHIVAMGAIPNQKAKLIFYEPVKEWITGMGFLELYDAKTGVPVSA